ncbi:galactose mutarotase-like enzyme [Sphaerochaeta pleomorpha str. Grapes]|uniref:Galactose mutarotase-like enzyme n=1 Tax=Sphaerochaeta pleomorpha (strain ATCC BAA-1885 / DSM 22778 / Grapes) TaxID=158190 RepID=G8QQI6_SPHPG|nr:galactose mutarotase [Sphaerochaeta pleomorpha]AEV30916.1 galactose mutarotase-like enzyme [Sphaerochaeta pleomorpha str. Grapes]
MFFTLSNEFLHLTIDSLGARPCSISTPQGLSYLTDPAIQSSPFLFPFVGRQCNNRYTYRGTGYEIPIHGFIRNKEFSVEYQDNNSLTLFCCSDADTLSQYPFPFRFDLTYRLRENCLEIIPKVTNTGKEAMYYGFGFHPAFNAPIEGGEFSHCFLEFPKATVLEEQPIALSKLALEKRLPFPLKESRLDLTHELFDNDARILYGTGGEVTFSQRHSPHRLTICYDTFPQLVIWQRPKMKGNTICLEPCTSLPAFDGKTTELTEQKDLVFLASNTSREHAISIVFA